MAFKIPKEITPQQVAERLKNGEAPTLLDVREPAEWVEGHVIGAKHIPLGQLLMRIDELDPNAETIVMCLSGGRSGLACELLSEKGYNVVNMTGGLGAWTDDFWCGGNSHDGSDHTICSISNKSCAGPTLRLACPFTLICGSTRRSRISRSIIGHENARCEGCRRL